MINIDMKHYNYFTFGEVDEYGQEQLSANVKGQVKMAIYTSTQSIQDNVNYKSAQYIGLTKDNVNDTFVIQYEDMKLKVLYVVLKGRYKQVFLSEI